MSKNAMISMLASASVMLAACTSPESENSANTFPILDSNGSETGILTLNPIAKGGVAVNVQVKGLTPGTHAMHFHAIGRCDGPDYKSAGGHYNPLGVSHGNVEDGPHAGDMMNVEVNDDGTGEFKIINAKVSLSDDDLPSLMDADGTALIIHAKADDYKSQPSGAAGPRIACAVIPAG